MIRLRPATIDDADFLFQLRNLPANREFFRNTAEVRWDQHMAWLEKALRDPKCEIHIAMQDDKAIGQFRVDGNGEVSVSLIDSAKGAGSGAALIRMASAASVARYSEGLAAYVKAQNIRSQKSFLTAGYIYDCDLERDGEQYKRYIFSKDAL